MIDGIDSVIWRPYLGFEDWEEDATKLLYAFRRRYLIKKIPYILDKHLIDRIYRQFWW